jgi:hypothetical protein
LLVAVVALPASAHAGDAPVIVQQPQSIMVPIGETLRLSCVVTGTPPIAYIWQRDGVFLGDQTNALLTITNAQPAHSGRYRLTASNDDGLARSTNAEVVVYTNHLCDFPPSWVSYYRGLTLEEAIPLGVTQLGDGQALVSDGAGNLYVLGDAYSVADSGVAAKTIKYDAVGRQVWVASYHQELEPPYTFNNRGNAITLDSAGNVLVAAVAWCSDGNPQGQWRQVYAVVKYSPDGAQLWANRFTNSCGYSGSTVSYSIGTGEHGGVYVSGSVGVVKYSNEGDFVWSSCGRYNNTRIRVLTNGLGCYMTGTTHTSPSDLLLVRYDTNGTALWTTNLNFGVGPTGEDLNGNGIAVDGSNNLFAAVSSSVPGDAQSEDIVAVKFASDGTHLWTRRFGSANRPDRASDFAAAGTGDLIVAGDSWTAPTSPASPSDFSGFDIRVLKYAPDGTLLWSASYGDETNSEDRAQSVAIDPDGNIYVSGFSRPTGQMMPNKGVVLKYSPDGTLLWRMCRGDYPYYLATDSAGDVFATGSRNFRARTSGGEGWYSELLAIKLGQNEPRLAVCTGLQEGWFHGSLVSPRGSQFEILANTSLLGGGWQTVWTVTNFNGLVPFYDPQAGQHPARFYRARQSGP